MSEDVLLRQLLGPFKEYRQAQTKEDETRTMVMLWKIVWFMSRLNTNISNHKNTKRRKLTQKSASLYQTSRTIASRDNKFERRSRGSFAKLMFQKYLLFPSAVSRRLWNINRPNLKSLKKRLPNIIDFTGDENDYVVFSDLWEHFNSSETPKEVGDALVKMGIMEKIIRVDGNSKAVRLGIKLKDFETRLYPTLIYKLERDNES